MAGEGRRFIEVGCRIPKPLIPIDDVPMVVRAVRCLSGTDKWIFICRENHIQDSNIDAKLHTYFKDPIIIGVKELTQGQACTCLLARDVLRPEDQLTIGACDNSMTYDRRALSELLEDRETDCLIWTFRQNPAVLQDPKMYGWVVTDDDNVAQCVSCKIQISDTPLNDHAIIGTFTFKKAKDFIDCTDTLIAADRRINGEFYVDEVVNVAIESGLRVKVFEVGRYICWGTPQDVDIYNYWRSYFRQIDQGSSL